MNQTSDTDSSIVISYLMLRKAIGWLGISLPFFLILGNMWIFGEDGIESSLSAYYHTDMGDVFVGTLCVIGFFLFAYKGEERADDIAGDLACVSAVGVALFATAPNDTVSCFKGQIVYCPHGIFAGALFLILAYFCLFLFTKTSQSNAPTRRKLTRNKIYRACGYTILGCVALGVIESLINKFLPGGFADAIRNLDPTFWLETIAILAFSFSWLTKGEQIFADE